MSAGVHLGPYEILELIGAGGMGEVYRARDTRLGRVVALKILAGDIATSADARVRFEREARTVSQLSHPHICQLHDIGTADGTAFLVMELLEGETLAARLVKGPLPLDVTLRYGAQICDALDAAHRAGIVHRDLKPANVMLGKSGVKLLDFGLAKAAPATTFATQAATTPPVTVQGALTGTLQYMAPELLEGHAADARSDIYALGAVLYEMATGERVFRSTLRTIAPASLDRIVRGCLAADPDERWQSARDVRLQLASISTAENAAPTTTHRGPAFWVPWAVAALALAVAGAIWVGALRGSRTSGSAPTVRFWLPVPTGGSFLETFENNTLAMAPDGSRIGFIGRDASRVSHIYVRDVAALQSQPLAGTVNAFSMVWSPDSRSIAFFVDGKLKRIDLPGGAPVTLCDVPEGVGISATWGDGAILYATVGGEAIYRVSTNGGVPSIELKPNQAAGERRTGFPWFMPDGRRFVYLVRLADGGRIMFVDPGKPPKTILPAVSNAQFVEPGYLVYARERTLLAQPFDPIRGELSGTPISIADSVSYFYSTAVARFSTSLNGGLVLQTEADAEHVAWLDRAGNEIGTVGQPGTYLSLRISPDGTHVIYGRAQPQIGTFDLWNADLVRGGEQRLTSDVTSEVNAIWHPSGGNIVFGADRDGPPHLYRRELTTGVETELLPATGLQTAEDFSRDGSVVVFSERSKANPGLWTLSVGADRRRLPLLESRFVQVEARFSPDGQYFSFNSSESGQPQIYVSPYPPTGAKVLVSPVSGRAARWSRDGRELYFLTYDRRLMAVPIRTTPTLSLGAPTLLFPLPGRRIWKDYDVSPDGKRFLAIVTDAAGDEQPLTVVTNWKSEAQR